MKLENYYSKEGTYDWRSIIMTIGAFWKVCYEANLKCRLWKKVIPKKISKFRLKISQKRRFNAIFRYRRIGSLGRIFGTEYSADFGRIFGRIFGIRSYTTENSSRKYGKTFQCACTFFHVKRGFKVTNQKGGAFVETWRWRRCSLVGFATVT